MCRSWKQRRHLRSWGVGLVGGMGADVVLLQELDANLGVHLRRLQLRVSKQLLDDAHVGSVLQHVSCAGMAQYPR